jgi:hypothetical protein
VREVTGQSRQLWCSSSVRVSRVTSTDDQRRLCMVDDGRLVSDKLCRRFLSDDTRVINVDFAL